MKRKLAKLPPAIHTLSGSLPSVFARIRPLQANLWRQAMARNVNMEY
jgi:hypothetical protein